ALLVKCFNGLGFNTILSQFRAEFVTVKQIKPGASRDKSSEMFLLGKTLKNPY
ncbi:MAG: rRNA methyltransferase, partial [Burkholderiales bacterium]|nr:rRNA methyltransferase [Burkholderiales bacterium]